jgi:hypothetical protein
MAKPNDQPFGQKQRDLNVHEWSQPRSDSDTESVTRQNATEKAKEEITKPGRDRHIEIMQSSRKTLATALRELEKTIPLKAGLKYIKNNLRPNLPKHLSPGYRLPSNSTIKGIVSMMKRGQL